MWQRLSCLMLVELHAILTAIMQLPELQEFKVQRLSAKENEVLQNLLEHGTQAHRHKLAEDS